MAVVKPLAYMRVMNAIYTRIAPLTSNSRPLVVLATWYAANDTHIAKYVNGYHTIFPESRILLIRCTAGHILRPWTVPATIAPAMDLLRDETARSRESASTCHRPQMQLHVFSNGGCNTVRQLLHTLRHTSEGVLELPRYTLVTHLLWTLVQCILSLLAPVAQLCIHSLVRVPLLSMLSLASCGVFISLYVSPRSKIVMLPHLLLASCSCVRPAGLIFTAMPTNLLSGRMLKIMWCGLVRLDLTL